MFNTKLVGFIIYEAILDVMFYYYIIQKLNTLPLHYLCFITLSDTKLLKNVSCHPACICAYKIYQMLKKSLL